MATSSRSQVLSLYRMLMKESKKFPSYNYRTYALRRIRDGFRENKNVSEPEALDTLMNQAWDSLAVIQRQLLDRYEKGDYWYRRRVCVRDRTLDCRVG